MSQLNWLFPSFSLSISVREVSSAGMAPVNSLKSSSKPHRLVNCPSSAGIVPLKSLLRKSKARRLVNCPSSAGIVPLNWLSSKLRCVRDVRKTSDSDAFASSPSRLLPGRSTLISSPSLLSTIPCHSENGRALFQLLLFIQLSPLVFW